MTETIQTEKPKGRPPKKKFDEKDFNADGSVKIGTKAAAEIVPAGINPDYEITAFQRDHCYVFRAWGHSDPNGRQGSQIVRDHNISYHKRQWIALAGSGGNTKRKKKTCSPVDYMQGKFGNNCELINEPKY